jgi:hypothetical protein
VTFDYGIEMLLYDGEFPISKEHFVKKTETHYIFKIPTKQAIAYKLISMAMST